MSTSSFRLRIYHDHITDGVTASLAAERRVVYCVSGSAIIAGDAGEVSLGPDEGSFSGGPARITSGPDGAQIWRWELVAPDAPDGRLQLPGIKSTNAGDYELNIDTSIPRLMRLDRVSFPPSGEALTHIHAAPGVRCLLEGSMLIESLGHRFRLWPGDSWVEHGPDAVYARASITTPTSFVRVMIVPQTYKGKSTITYVKPEDFDRPKSQSYKRYLEEPISL